MAAASLRDLKKDVATKGIKRSAEEEEEAVVAQPTAPSPKSTSPGEKIPGFLKNLKKRR